MNRKTIVLHFIENKFPTIDISFKNPPILEIFVLNLSLKKFLPSFKVYKKICQKLNLQISSSTNLVILQMI